MNYETLFKTMKNQINEALYCLKNAWYVDAMRELEKAQIAWQNAERTANER